MLIGIGWAVLVSADWAVLIGTGWKVVIGDAWKVLACGSNSSGQLGLGLGPRSSQAAPARVEELCDLGVTQARDTLASS